MQPTEHKANLRFLVLLIMIGLIATLQACSPVVSAQEEMQAEQQAVLDTAAFSQKPDTTQLPDWQTAQWDGLDFGPYVTLRSAQEASFQWRTLLEATSGLWIDLPGDEDLVIHDGTQELQHAIRVSDLQPGNSYPYRVWSESSAGIFVSPEYVLRWLPADGESLRLALQSDTHGLAETADYTPILQEFQPHLILDSGDHVFDTDNFEQWRGFFRASGYLAEIPSLHIMGNHGYEDYSKWCLPMPFCADAGSDNWFNQLFDLPGNERWYSVELDEAASGSAGSIAFIGLDSNYRFDKANQREQMEWLDQTVDSLRRDADTPNFIISFWHHAPPQNEPVGLEFWQKRWLNENFIPRIEELAVELVLVGHDYAYVRNQVDATTYVQVSTGVVPKDIPRPFTDFSNTKDRSMLLLEIADEQQMVGRTVSPTGAVLDQFEISSNVK